MTNLFKACLLLPFTGLLFSQQAHAEVIITGILDGTLPGGSPKAIELYIDGTEDLSEYFLDKAANGSPFNGANEQLSGIYTDEFVYLTNNAGNFEEVFGVSGDFSNLLELAIATGNGNDAFRIVGLDNEVVDQVWYEEDSDIYRDSYMYRVNNTGPDGAYVAANWMIPGANILDDATGEEIAEMVPFGSYQHTLVPTITYYVSADGAGSQNGLSESNAASSVGAIMDLLNPGDDIILISGVVSETADVILPEGVVLHVMDDASWNLDTYNLENNGNVILEASAALVQGSSSELSGAGNYEVIRKASINSSTFNLLSSPIDEVSVEEVYEGSNVLSFIPADHANGYWGWNFITSGTLDNAQGFAVNGAALPDFNGKRHYQGTVNNGEIIRALDGQAHGSIYDGWNLIGNPYPSAISIEDFVTSNTDVGMVTIYDQESGSYVAYNLINAADMEIASGQGFFVEFSLADAGSAVFSNALRTQNGAGDIRREASMARSAIRITNDLGQAKQNIIAFTANASDAYDLNFDAPLIPGVLDFVSYTKLGDKKLAIQSFGEFEGEKTVSLEMELQEGIYTIDLGEFTDFPVGTSIFLIDQWSGEAYDLQADVFTFTVTGDVLLDDRFAISTLR